MERKGLKILRRNLKVFIDADYREINLERPKKMATEAGGWIEGQFENLPPQRARLVPAKRRRGDPEIDSQDGNIPVGDWELVGYIDIDIKRDDEFSLNGERYKVLRVTPDTDEREFTDRLVAQLEMKGKAAV